MAKRKGLFRPLHWAEGRRARTRARAWAFGIAALAGLGLLLQAQAANPAGTGGAGGPGTRGLEPSDKETAGLLAESLPIPAGEVTLGSDAAQKEFGYGLGGAAARRGKWFDHEPLRRVSLPAFWMDATLVTQRAYGIFLRATGRRRPFITRDQYQRQGFLVHSYESVLPFLWFSDLPVAWLAEHPVVLVNVADAGAFCAWRGRREQRICRLPTEDQWEKAARGAGGRYYPWGNRWEPERVNTAASGPFTTTPVKRYPRGLSPYGLYDMAGNLFQWTATPGRPGRNILKGCSWDDAGGICRGAARHGRPVESRHILIGFRCACQAPPSKGN